VWSYKRKLQAGLANRIMNETLFHKSWEFY
jgi:hypothetical protein